jgi:hypothetical protein
MPGDAQLQTSLNALEARVLQLEQKVKRLERIQLRIRQWFSAVDEHLGDRIDMLLAYCKDKCS